MIQTLQVRRAPRVLSFALALTLCGPVLVTLAGCGNKGGDTGQAANTQAAPTGTAAPNGSAMSGNAAAPAKQGMSTGKKAVIVLAGAALLYYLYKKHQAAQQQAGTQGNGATPQLYRSSNGGVYYRDPQNPQKVTWLTVPNQPVSVPQDQVQQYAPDYQKYQGQAAPPVPAGQSSQSFSQYDPNAASQ
jgi:hypothetical protein